MPPAVVGQVAQLAGAGVVARQQRLGFRCIGVRTDMKAKVFEWLDETLDVPVGLLREARSAREVRFAIEHAEQIEQDIWRIFGQFFRPGGQDAQGKRERFQAVRARMAATYWAALTAPFGAFVLTAADPASVDAASRAWMGQLVETGGDAFEALEEVGDRGSALRRRVEATQACRIRLAGRRKDWLQ